MSNLPKKQERARQSMNVKNHKGENLDFHKPRQSITYKNAGRIASGTYELSDSCSDLSDSTHQN